MIVEAALCQQRTAEDAECDEAEGNSYQRHLDEQRRHGSGDEKDRQSSEAAQPEPTWVQVAYVVALGSYSPALLRPLGIQVPVYPVKGYSLTVPIVDPASAPVSTVMDETFKVGITRLGDRIRVLGVPGCGRRREGWF